MSDENLLETIEQNMHIGEAKQWVVPCYGKKTSVNTQ